MPQSAILGKYEILRHIATGGMAEVYLARASGIQGFKKLVVIKRILPRLAANGEIVRMFLDEARLAAMLQHSNVVQVYDFGRADGQYFLAMEFLEGHDLSEVMQRAVERDQGVPLEHALNIGLGLCAGLHYAHERHAFDGQPLNIVHRDVSPANVFLTYDGGVKVVDFGVAKAATRLTTTRAGRLRGKVRYMSPEQVRGDELDRRSDIFAVGVVLWELTTGQRLRQSETELQVMREVVEQDVPRPSTRQPGYPAALERILMRALSRNREERHATARALQLELEELAREQRLRTSPLALADYMHDLFGAELEAWRTAQRQGPPVVEQAARTMIERATIQLAGLEPPLEGAGVPLAGTAAPAISLPARDRAPSRTTWVIAAVLLVAAGLLVTLTLAGRRGGAPRTEPRPPAASAPAPLAAPASASAPAPESALVPDATVPAAPAVTPRPR